MRLLVLCERVDDEGGTESYLRIVLPALAASNDTVRVLARSAERSDAYGVPAEAIEWSDEHDPPSGAAAARVAVVAREFAPDAIVAHNVLDAGVLEASLVTGARAIYHLHDHRPFCPNGDRLYPQRGGICSIPMSARGCGFHSLVHGCAYGPRLRTLRLVAIRQAVADRVRGAHSTIVFSRYVADLALRNGVAAERLAVVAPPLDDAAFASAPSLRPSRDAVLFAGRVVPSKGARSLVRVLAHIDRDSRPLLRIAGEGPDLGATLEEAGARGVAVEVLGRLDAPALRAAYDAATVVAMPSTWGEPFGLVGIEAFARGRPVVAYDSGGIAQWLEPGAGALVARGDERALAAALAGVLESQRWGVCAAGAFAAAAHYRLRDHVARLRDIYAGSA